eukprot:TRINITY_DN33744_c0_g1_i1.p1 TRINITY_DN33744_c0_g1~~TRINITY_DN33744_c0_g1_i1.p1  ORF type:complete len:653 (+),score=56.94 TRINITY_DN33744_c0_g1_i1:84-2042(+)
MKLLHILTVVIVVSFGMTFSIGVSVNRMSAWEASTAGIPHNRETVITNVQQVVRQIEQAEAQDNTNANIRRALEAAVHKMGADETYKKIIENHNFKCRTSITGRLCIYPFTYENSKLKGSVMVNNVRSCPVEVNLENSEAITFEPCGNLHLTDSPPETKGSCKHGKCNCNDDGGTTLMCTDERLSCPAACDALYQKPHEGYFNKIIATTIVSGWQASKPSSISDISSLLRLEPPSYHSVSDQFHGTGIVIASGGTRMLSAVATALFIRLQLKSTLPIEIWRTEGEGEITQDIIDICQQHDVFHVSIPMDFGPGIFGWEDRWQQDPKHELLSSKAVFTALKPYVMLLSHFDTVIFFDDDAIPTIDPAHFTSLLENGISAVFWRDLWSLYPDASIWTILKWPGENPKTAPAQDSGTVVVCKSCDNGKGWEGLYKAGYMNFHHSVFYPSLYLGSFKNCKGGCTAFGIGDKDTFQASWISINAKYSMMPALSLVGAKRASCGPVLGQPGPDGSILVLHMNSNKLSYRDYKKKSWDKSYKRYGHSLQQVISHTNPDNANIGDGRHTPQIKWSGLPRSGAARCLSFLKGHPNTKTPLRDNVGTPWDIEEAIHKVFVNVFETKWADAYYVAVAPPETPTPPTEPPKPKLKSLEVTRQVP